MRKILFIAILTIAASALGSCDKCRKVECENSGVCEEGICDCPEGFSGVNCEVEDLCITQDVSCANGGECVDGECDCATFYHGTTCTDRCVYGTYSDGVCSCEQGFEASDCDTESREKFIGTYINEDKNGDVHSCLIKRGDFENGDVWKVEMTGLSTFGDSDGYAEIDGDKISIPAQTVLGQGNVSYDVESTEAGTFVDADGEITFTIKVTRQSTLPNSVEETDTYKYSRPSL